MAVEYIFNENKNLTMIVPNDSYYSLAKNLTWLAENNRQDAEDNFTTITTLDVSVKVNQLYGCYESMKVIEAMMQLIGIQVIYPDHSDYMENQLEIMKRMVEFYDVQYDEIIKTEQNNRKRKGGRNNEKK